MKKTKIICTLGPATDDDQVLADMIKAGMDVARFNFSHGDYDAQSKRLEQLIRVREAQGVPVATLLDTKGPGNQGQEVYSRRGGLYGPDRQG